MESKWALNAYLYGLTGYLDYAAQFFGHRPVLYAALDDGTELISNVAFGVCTTCLASYDITGDDRVSFTYSGVPSSPPGVHFPYGYPVEPDQLP